MPWISHYCRLTMRITVKVLPQQINLISKLSIIFRGKKQWIRWFWKRMSLFKAKTVTLVKPKVSFKGMTMCLIKMSNRVINWWQGRIIKLALFLRERKGVREGWWVITLQILRLLTGWIRKLIRGKLKLNPSLQGCQREIHRVKLVKSREVEVLEARNMMLHRYLSYL